MRRFAILVLVALALAPPPSGSASAAGAPDLARLQAIAAPLDPIALDVPALAFRAALPLPPILGAEAAPPPDCGAEADAGDGWDDATRIAAPADCSGTLGAGDDVDLYLLDAAALHTLRATVASPPDASASADASPRAQARAFDVCLATPHRVVVACGFDGAPAQLVTNESGAWYVAVVRHDGAGAYGLRVDVDPAAPEGSDCGGPGANDPALAQPLAWPASCEGSTRFLDDVRDWYRLADGTLRVFGSASAPALACLFLADDALHPLSCGLLGETSAYAGTPGHGGYLLLIFSPNDASYHVEIEAAPAQDDCGAGHDAPGNVFLGLPASGQSCVGALTSDDAADVLVVSLPEGVAMGVEASFAPGVDAMLCVIPVPTPTPTPSPSPSSCEIAWAGGAGIARAGAPAGPAREVLVATVAVGDTPYSVAWETHAPSPQDDCATGADARGGVLDGTPIAMPIDCEGAIVAQDGDVWDLYRVEFSEGPVYAHLFALFDAELCLVDAGFTSAACSSRGELRLSWPAGPAYVAVIRTGGSGSYHLRVEQQDDCGTGADALWSGAEVGAPLVRCEALLDVFAGDAEDAFLIPPPIVPDVVVVRMEPSVPRLRLCVDDEVRSLGLRSRCTDSTFSRILVARDPLRPIRVTVDGFSVDPFGYTLIVEDPVAHPPQVPPLL